jgi:hypothetical protein
MRSIEVSARLALGETGGVIARAVYRLHELRHRDRSPIKKDRRLPAVEVHLNLVNAGVTLKRLPNGLFALVAMHAFDANDGKLIPTYIR